jgi:hypothetical protein
MEMNKIGTVQDFHGGNWQSHFGSKFRVVVSKVQIVIRVRDRSQSQSVNKGSNKQRFTPREAEIKEMGFLQRRGTYFILLAFVSCLFMSSEEPISGDPFD